MGAILDNQTIEKIKAKEAFICDMDGVIYHGNRLLPGVKEFVKWLQTENKKFLFLTNSSERSPKELQEKLQRLGIEVGENHFFTSALATASFLSSQKPNGSAYIIGEPGLINAMYEAGYTMNNVNPDYVVVGETSSYSYEKIEKAINLDEKMIRIACRKNRDPSIQYHVMDASALGFADRTFDAIIDFGIIHHVPNWKDCTQTRRKWTIKPYS